MVRRLVRSDHPVRDIVTETLLDPAARTLSPTIRAGRGDVRPALPSSSATHPAVIVVLILLGGAIVLVLAAAYAFSGAWG